MSAEDGRVSDLVVPSAGVPRTTDLVLVRPAPEACPGSGTPDADARVPLRAWQAEALAAWRDADRTGVVEAVTGAGKTRVGIAAVSEAATAGMRAVVLVPTRTLVAQWADSLHELLPGMAVSTDLRASQPWRVMVTTVQAAHRRPALRQGESGLLVADECHRYGAESFSRALRPEYAWRLGLTATLARGDAGDSILRDYFGPVCFGMGYQRPPPTSSSPPSRSLSPPCPSAVTNGRPTTSWRRPCSTSVRSWSNTMASSPNRWANS